ncbi:MAG: hypothetical protein LUI10_07200 [Lachnospiraceae bacterium]|nr:hypothetical protein [Lachnospiraceae bacterium]
MKEPELPRQTKPTAGKPKKNAQTKKQKIPQSSDSGKQSEQRRKKASGKAQQRSAHPYDDAFHTLLKTCSPLILPVLNEMFGEHYTGKERIDFHSEQHRLNKQDGNGEWRITDSTFTVIDAMPKHYLLEVQSTADNSMLVRIFEYSTQEALAAAELTKDALHVTIPQSGVLFLRSNSNTPDRMQIRIDTPGGAVTFDVQVLKTKEYTIDEIFEKNLLMLIPFYIFSHEKNLQEYNTNDEKLRELKTEYHDIIDRLKVLKEHNQLTEYQYHMLIDMSRNVLDYIAKKYDKVRKGVREFMGGRIIETEATRIYREGERKGENLKSEQTAIRLYNMGDGYEKIAIALDVDIQQIQKWIRNSSTPAV